MPLPASTVRSIPSWFGHPSLQILPCSYFVALWILRQSATSCPSVPLERRESVSCHRMEASVCFSVFSARDLMPLRPVLGGRNDGIPGKCVGYSCCSENALAARPSRVLLSTAYSLNVCRAPTTMWLVFSHNIGEILDTCLGSFEHPFQLNSGLGQNAFLCVAAIDSADLMLRLGSITWYGCARHLCRGWMLLAL